MAAIGNSPTQQAFTPAIDYFSGNGSTTAFTLSRPVASVAQVQVTIDNVAQNPSSAFTVSANTITFTSAPLSGTNNIYVYYTSPITQVIAPGQGTVGTAQIQNGVTVNFADGTAAAPSITNDGDTNTGIFFPAADTIAFAEGGAESMRIDSSGKVLIGASSSDLSGTSQAMVIGSGGLAVQFGGTTGTYLKVNPGDANGVVNLTADARSGNYPAMTFTTSATERMRIDSSGQVGIGVSPYAPLTVAYAKASDVCIDFRNTSGTTPYGMRMALTGATPNNNSQYFITTSDATATRAVIYTNGGLANYSANNVNLSDRREKTNFAPAKAYLDIVCNIPVQTFNYIDQNREEDDGLTLGVVAQDVQAVAPELVMESNWGSKDEPKMRLSIYQTDLQYALMKSIQELSAKNDALTARIEALENR